MGYIKKLKNNELVGGTDKTTIYPVTSTEAVFEEITNGNENSFKSQKTINKEQQDELDDHEERIQAAEAEDIKSITINGSTKKFEVDDENNVDLTIYTVDNDPEMPSIANNVEDLRNMVGTSTPVLETSHKTRIETLEGDESVTGSVENKIKTKVDSINSSYQDDDNEYVKYSMTQTSGEVTDFNIDETNLKNAIASLNTSISGDNIVIRSGSTPSGTGEAGKIYRYVNSSNNTYTDYMYSGGSWVTLATHDTSNEQAQVAYYTCIATGSGAQAIKQFVGNGSLTYNPSSGGHIKILMGEANTATGTIYLKFGTTSATDSTKKPLYYNGEPVSANNTWEAGETIAVYYDPSANSNAGAYFASNAQGGGGKAEKIKYDNSQSGLAAENVQGALDEIGDELYTQSNYPFELGSIDGSNGENVTKTDGTRIRTIGIVPKSSSVVNFTITRSCTRVSIILYENGGYKGWIDGAYTNISAGSYTYEVNVNYTWDSYRIACITSGYTSQNLDGNYCIWNSSIKDNVLQLDEDVANINNVLPHGDAGSVSLELSESDYAYGNINGTYGSIDPNDKVIYLVDTLDVKNASSLSYSLDNNYRLGIAVYTDSKVFVKKDEWFTGSGAYSLEGVSFIRIVIAYPSGGSTFDYASANPHFLLYLNGLKQVASLDDVNDLSEHYDDALYFGEYNRFELGSIDGSSGNNVEKSDGTRIRTKGYVKKGDGIARLTFAISITRMWIVLYKGNEYVGWIDGAYTTTHAAGYYEYKINTQYDYDTYRIVCVTSGATSVTANNTYVYNPALAEYIYNIQDSQENINIEALNTAKIYEYYDALVEKFPNYISKRVLGMDTSGQHEIREYVATLRDNYAYLYKERCYAWKNGSTTIFTESISPRVGDATYSDQLTTSTGYTVSATNCNNQTITVNGVVYNRTTSDDIAADIQYRSTGTSSSITVSGKTYNRLPVYDKSSICKKTIVSICNEHGPGINGDPREPSVVMFYLLQALCGETSENPQLDWLKHYAKLVIIPVSNPYAYDEEGDSTELGNLMGRVNPNGVNINRNYPTTNWSSTSNGEAGTYGGSEIETQYNINCIMRHNADIAIDEHCLGPNTSNYNKWYYEGSIATLISQKIKMMMLATYNLAYNSYASGGAGRGDTWIEQHDIDGCLLEMNQGYDNTLHSDIILRADRQIWMGVLEYYDIFSL